MIDKDEYIKRTQEQVTAHEKAIENGLSKTGNRYHLKQGC